MLLCFLLTRVRRSEAVSQFTSRDCILLSVHLKGGVARLSVI